MASCSLTIGLLLMLSLGSTASNCRANPVQEPNDEQQEQRVGASASLPNLDINDALHYISPKLTGAQLLRARGYLAEEFKFTAPDNYILSITRGTNPLINEGKSSLKSKLPIVFLNASLLTCKSFLTNSEGVRPRAYNNTDVDLSQMSTEQLLELVGDDPAKSSLPFLALNFGYEIWCLDRRGYGQSRGIAGRRNRTLADAIASLPASFLGNAFGGFSLTGNIPLGRPNRVPAPPRTADANNTSGGGGGGGGGGRLGDFREALGSDTSWDEPEELPLPFNSSQLDEPERWFRQLFHLAKAPFGLETLASVRRDFIDTFDPDYWSFSIDEQAEIDFPAAIDFVLQQTGRPKVHTVGLSAGGATILLGLAAKPELADKISRAILWAPAINLGSKTDIDYQTSFIYPPLQSVKAPIPFLFQVIPIQKAIQAICGTELAQTTICEAAVDLVAGFTAGQAPTRPWFLSSALESVPPGEAEQLAQLSRTDVPCRFIYNTDEKNIAKYGQKTPPCYDLGQIRLANMSIYAGGTDTLVSPDDIQTTVSQLKVPVELNYIRGDGIFFNHIGTVLHRQTARLAIVPSLLDMERSQAQERA